MRTKRDYSISYLERKFGPAGAHSFIVSHLATLATVYGVPFSYTYTGTGRVKFYPVMRSDITPCPDHVEAVSAAYHRVIAQSSRFGYASFDTVAETAGVSFLDCISAVRWMQQDHRVEYITDLRSAIAYFRLNRSD